MKYIIIFQLTSLFKTGCSRLFELLTVVLFELLTVVLFELLTVALFKFVSFLDVDLAIGAWIKAIKN